MVPRRRRPEIDRFTEKVSPCPLTGCWWWTAAGLPKGYGFFAKPGGRGAHHLAHRVSWRLFRGSDPGEACVLHRCDQPACVNPDHLFLGTVQDNIADKVEKGRTPHGNGHYARMRPDLRATPEAISAGMRRNSHRMARAVRGEQNPRAKLTDAQVREIRARFIPGGRVGARRQPNSAGALSREYGVTDAMILRIAKRLAWAHVV